MKRIMHCIASLEVGGVEKRVLDSLDHLAQRGCRHQHTLVAFRGGAMESDRTERLRMAGMDCLNLHRHSRFDLRFAAALRKAVQDTQPDIIHAYNQTAALWVRRCKGRRLPQRVLVHCGGVGAFDRLWRHLERRMLGRTDAFVFNSESTRQVWTHFLNIRCLSMLYTTV